jgi:hypothetical protein
MNISKMILRVSLFVVCLMPYSGFSQYIPLLKNNAIWHVYHVYWEGGWTVTQQLTGDTVINNITYKILASSDSIGEGFFFLREDTTTKKVYQYVNDAEFLIYDFNLPIGSIFTYIHPQSPWWTTDLRLDSITSTIDPTLFDPATDWTTINPLRVYYFTNIDTIFFPQILWVEGLGSLSGLLLPAYPWGGGAFGEKILCHNSTVDTIDYHFVFWWETSPCIGPLLGLNNTEIKPAVNIYPVPITSNEVMITGEDIVLVQFINSLAVSVLDYSVSTTKSSINISNLPKGIYFLKIHFKNGQCLVQKTVKI